MTRTDGAMHMYAAFWFAYGSIRRQHQARGRPKRSLENTELDPPSSEFAGESSTHIYNRDRAEMWEVVLVCSHNDLGWVPQITIVIMYT